MEDELFAGYERYRALWLSEKLQKLFPVNRFPGNGILRRLPDSNKRRSFVRRASDFSMPLVRRPQGVILTGYRSSLRISERQFTERIF